MDLAQMLFDYRQETENEAYVHDLTQPKWYQDVPGLSDVEIDPGLITTSSDLFRIAATAELKGMRVRITAVVKRQKTEKSGKWNCRVLSWMTE